MDGSLLPNIVRLSFNRQAESSAVLYGQYFRSIFQQTIRMVSLEIDSRTLMISISASVRLNARISSLLLVLPHCFFVLLCCVLMLAFMTAKSQSARIICVCVISRNEHGVAWRGFGAEKFHRFPRKC